ncbi:MAG: hypothetical protein AVDCRST_MAG49-2065 [uncultured Thermomicrobiales bacterium]|uniref:Uncharacterized protein n=1 Tax=uncultured Thermomicrobiales bacterium TaxID=1645740 RepID=A0A6J4UPT7_9BACT|nr:MAG: hypothetical protein AVDCRST_MAG49-2065 [uncultured Thermomicrobiales bacterium]
MHGIGFIRPGVERSEGPTDPDNRGAARTITNASRPTQGAARAPAVARGAVERGRHRCLGGDATPPWAPS